MNRENYTRITTILAPFAGYGAIPKAVIEKAADRGTRAHNNINTILAGLGEWEIEEDVKGYVDSARKVFPRIGKIIHHETRFYDDDQLLTGQVDLIAEIDGIKTLVDWKTSSKRNPTWEAQAGGYSHLTPKGLFKRSLFIKLDKSGGEPEIFEFNNIDDCQQEFKECYKLYQRYFKHNKLEVFE